MPGSTAKFAKPGRIVQIIRNFWFQHRIGGQLRIVRQALFAAKLQTRFNLVQCIIPRLFNIEQSQN